jgi:alcohol dehydrogenase
MLPYVLRYSRPAITSAWPSWPCAPGWAASEESEDVLAEKFLDGVWQLNRDLGIPTCWQALKEADIPALAKAACHEAHTGYPVPRYMTQEGCEGIIRQAAAAGRPGARPRPDQAAPRKRKAAA